MFRNSDPILIVDDVESLRELLKAYLHRLGFRAITEAKDGQEALDALWEAHHKKTPFVLVISDWNMPRLSGLDLLKRVRTVEAWKNLPFILLTTESEKSKIVEAVLNQVTNYIVKPIEEPVLREKLEKTWEKFNKSN